MLLALAFAAVQQPTVHAPPSSGNTGGDAQRRGRYAMVAGFGDAAAGARTTPGATVEPIGLPDTLRVAFGSPARRPAPDRRPSGARRSDAETGRGCPGASAGERRDRALVGAAVVEWFDRAVGGPVGGVVDPADAGCDSTVARDAARMQADRPSVAFAPLVWTGTPGGPTAALRAQSTYRRVVNRADVGVAVASRAPEGSQSLAKLQAWVSIENPRFYGTSSAIMGLRAGAWALDGIGRFELSKGWDQRRFLAARDARVTLSLGAIAIVPYDRRWPDPARWSLARTYEARAGYERRTSSDDPTLFHAEIAGGHAAVEPAAGALGTDDRRRYTRATIEARKLFVGAAGRRVTMLRAYVGASNGAPRERLIYASSLDPVQSFDNHFLRPRGGVLSGPDARYVSLGNGGLRAYDYTVAGQSLAAANLEHAVRLHRFGRSDRPFDLFADAFADAGLVRDLPRRSPTDDRTIALADVGLGIAARGALFDRDVRFRLDFPFYVARPELVVSARRNDSAQPIGARFSFSFTDLY